MYISKQRASLDFLYARLGIKKVAVLADNVTGSWQEIHKIKRDYSLYSSKIALTSFKK